jgi:superfamily II DNA/RNA helicase
MKLDNCKFVAIDEVDDIFEQARDDLALLLEIVNASPSNLITCSATMKGQFMKFYSQVCPNHIKMNIN